MKKKQTSATFRPRGSTTVQHADSATCRVVSCRWLLTACLLLSVLTLGLLPTHAQFRPSGPAPSAYTPPPAKTVEIGAWGWFISPDGNIELESGDVSTSVSLNEIGADGSETIPGAFITLGDRFQLGAEAYQLSVGGDGNVSRTVSLFGFTTGLQSDVASDVDLTLARLFARYNIDIDGFRLGLEGGGQYADAQAELNSDLAGSFDVGTETVIPYAGLRAEFRPLEAFVIRGSLLYSSWEIDDIETSFTQLDLSAHGEFGKNVIIGGGYRQLDIEIDAPDDNVFADLDFSGPIVFAGLQF